MLARQTIFLFRTTVASLLAESIKSTESAAVFSSSPVSSLSALSICLLFESSAFSASCFCRISAATKKYSFQPKRLLQNRAANTAENVTIN
jgi:hypothetical protein